MTMITPTPEQQEEIKNCITDEDKIAFLNKYNIELPPEELAEVTGGCRKPRNKKLDYWIVDGCVHSNKTPTDEYREASYFIFWTKRQRKWYCHDCEKYVWIDV